MKSGCHLFRPDSQQFVFAAFLLFTMLTASMHLAAASSLAKSGGFPNVVLIVADDQTWSDSGVYGNPDVKTPNIDKLAEQGMRFNNAFTGTAMCAPTRQQLYTGLYPVHSGAYPQGGYVRDGTQSLVHYFKAMNYRVGLTGKRHFGPDNSFPFEVVGTVMGKAHPLVDLQATEEFISRDTAQPFFLVVASTKPHFPWNKGEQKYDPENLSIPASLVDTPETRSALANYYREVSELDRQIGAVDKILERTDQVDNTIFIYTSEQGAMFPGAKWTLYDRGIKTAFIVRWPGKVVPSVSDAMVHYIDVVPTLVDAVGGVPPKVDGESFLAVLQGKRDSHRDLVFGVHTNIGTCNGREFPSRSVRSQTFKLILNFEVSHPYTNNLTVNNKGDYYESWRVKGEAGDEDALSKYYRYKNRQPAELYDVVNDPLEQHNLIEEVQYDQVRTDLESALREWMETQGDARPIETELAAWERVSPEGLAKLKSPGCQSTESP